MKTFDQLISDIINKQPLDMKLMADFFMLPGREERSSVNLKLGSAFGQAGDIDKATECLRRVWELGSGNFSIFYSYFQLLKHRGHYADAINLCREAAVCLERQLKAEDIMLIYQLRSSLGFSIDPGTYFDRIIYEVLNRLLNGRKLKIQLRHNIFISDKIKLGYFLWGEEADNSTLFKNNLMIGKHHNTEKFEVRFYSYFTEDRICASNKSAADMFHQMRMNRIKFVTINTGKSFIEQISNTINFLLNENLDILIFNCQIGIYFLIAYFRPAPIILGLSHGCPEAYTSPALDLAINFSKHPTMESLCDAAFILGAVQMPSNSDFPYNREQFGLSKDNVVLISAGTKDKFDRNEYWHILGQILKLRENTQLLIAGVTPDSIPFLKEVVSDDVLPRIRFLGWRSDYNRILPIADIYVDTFPAGGGFSVYEALYRGIPVVSFETTYFHKWEQRKWNPALEVLDVKDMIIPANNTEAFVRRVLDLIDNPPLRQYYGEIGRQAVNVLSDYRRLAHQCEEIYINLLRRKLEQQRSSLSDSREGKF